MAKRAIPALATKTATPIRSNAAAKIAKPTAPPIKAGPKNLTKTTNAAIAAIIPKNVAIAPPPALDI